MVVIPGVGGLALHSPLMRDSELISLKGINFCHQLISRLPFHIFDSESTKLDEVSSDFEPSGYYYSFLFPESFLLTYFLPSHRRVPAYLRSSKWGSWHSV